MYFVDREVRRDEEEPAFFYHSDHLGSAAYLTYHGGVVQTLNYLPYGEDWVELNFFAPHDTTRLGIYRFNGKEKDYESGFHYYGARYYWSEVLTSWLSVDPMADKYPSISPYAYCAWNPVRLVDPDGRWVWNSYGNLVAQKGDNINTMSTFLGTSVENCATMLNRCGLISSSGVNITAGCTLPQRNLWIEGSTSSDYYTVDNNFTAILHYYVGGGTSVNIGDKSTSLLYNSTEFLENHTSIISNSQKKDGVFSVNMTGDMFHIGRTNVKYTKNRGHNTSTITYSAFSDDGFWDPAFWSENTLGKWGVGGDLYKPDGKGGHLEMGGVPYDYIPRERTYFYKPEE